MKLISKAERCRDYRELFPCIDFKIRGKLAGITYPCYAEIKHDGISVTVIKKPEFAEGTVMVMTGRFARQIECDSITRHGLYLAEWAFEFGLWDTLKHVSDANIVLTNLYVFDTLASEGNDVSEKDWLTRKEITTMSTTTYSVGQLINNREELQAMFDKVTAAGFEGLVVKNLNESFLMQKWVKMKPPERMNHGTTNNGE